MLLVKLGSRQPRSGTDCLAVSLRARCLGCVRGLVGSAGRWQADGENALRRHVTFGFETARAAARSRAPRFASLTALRALGAGSHCGDPCRGEPSAGGFGFGLGPGWEGKGAKRGMRRGCL